jgi:hypothetical protein
MDIMEPISVQAAADALFNTVMSAVWSWIPFIIAVAVVLAAVDPCV